jgi:hypothetical protein
MTFSRRLFVMIVAVALAATPVAPAEGAHTIQVPTTLARNVLVGERGGRVSVGLPPTHVAFSWSGPEASVLRYRVISAGTKSAWRRVRESEDMATTKRHFSAVFVVDRPDAIDWDVVKGPVESVTLHEMNTVDGPRRTINVASAAPTMASTPDIVTRAEWGADESTKRTEGGCTRRFFDVQQLFVHHTAGRNNDPNPPATMRAIYWYHVRERGWCDIGYNFVIGSDGRIFEARWARNYRPWEVHDSENQVGFGVVGAHAEGFNSASIGVSLMGNFENVRLPVEMRAALVELLAWEVDRHDLSADRSHVYRNPETGVSRRLPFIAGHRDVGETACPGRNVYRALKEIRTEVAAAVGTGRAPARVRLRSDEEVVDFGDDALLSGSLRDEIGGPLASRPVTLYARGIGHRWRSAGDAVTDAQGRYSFTFFPRRTSTAVATFAGDDAFWEADSRAIRIGVRPRVTLLAEGGSEGPDGVRYFDAETRLIRFLGDVRPRHPGGVVSVRIVKLRGDGSYRELADARRLLDSAGSYRYRFRLPNRWWGTYRATARFLPDSDHLGARSSRVDFVVSAE